MTRVLFFAPRDCRPPNTGAKLRNYHLCRELSRAAHVTYLSFEDANGETGVTDGLAEIAARVITVPHGSLSSPLQLVRGLVGIWPLTVLNYTTPAMQNRLARLLQDEDFDLVFMHSLLMAAYVPLFKRAKNPPLLLCDWHNIDSEVLERYAAHAPNLPRKLYALATAKRLAKLEHDQLPNFDGHTTVSDRDSSYLLELLPDARVWTLENGTETAGFAPGEVGGAQVRRYAERRQNDRRQHRAPLSEGQAERRKGDRRQGARRENGPPHRILFVGSMDYHPNIDAARFFARETWPQIHAARPDWVFTIVGRDPAPAVRELAQLPGIYVTGTVPDVRPFYREALACVVPLRVGGGSRLKILEAMAARVPVVSTVLGAEGLDVRDGQELLIREEPQETADALLELSQNNALRLKIVENAHELVLHRYDWSAIGARLRGICAELLENPRFETELLETGNAPNLEAAPRDDFSAAPAIAVVRTTAENSTTSVVEISPESTGIAEVKPASNVTSSPGDAPDNSPSTPPSAPAEAAR